MHFNLWSKAFHHHVTDRHKELFKKQVSQISPNLGHVYATASACLLCQKRGERLPKHTY